MNESQIEKPALTPVFADGTVPLVFPFESDPPPLDLITADDEPGNYNGMRGVAIPRHGNSPRPPSRNWPSTQPLPGAVNVTFYDGHLELVKLDQLWQLYWHRGYVPRAKRPGL